MTGTEKSIKRGSLPFILPTPRISWLKDRVACVHLVSFIPEPKPILMRLCFDWGQTYLASLVLWSCQDLIWSCRI